MSNNLTPEPMAFCYKCKVNVYVYKNGRQYYCPYCHNKIKKIRITRKLYNAVMSLYK